MCFCQRFEGRYSRGCVWGGRQLRKKGSVTPGSVLGPGWWSPEVRIRRDSLVMLGFVCWEEDFELDALWDEESVGTGGEQLCFGCTGVYLKVSDGVRWRIKVVICGVGLFLRWKMTLRVRQQLSP